MLTYANVLEIGAKGERLNFWRMAYPETASGCLGLRVLGDTWKSLTVAELEAMAKLQPIIAEIRRRGHASGEDDSADSARGVV